MSSKSANYDKLQQEKLAVIFNLTRLMSAIEDEEEMLETLLVELIKETGAEVGAFIYYDKNQEQFIPRKTRTFSGLSQTNIAFSQTVFSQVLKSKQAVLSFDMQKEEDYRKAQSVIINEIHAVLAFPLIIKEEVYGIMYFDSRRNRQGFNEAARQFLSFFSVIASLALEQVLRKKQVENENILLKEKLDQDIRIETIIGNSVPMKRLFRLMAKVAKSDVSVIITGENGTGKELVARAIHDLSPRKEKPYIAQYIGNIPATILESELFGYKKGAFTGAHKDKPGLFEAAQGGTLFLDEIGDLDADLQAKMLRVLQNKEIKRLGENHVRKVDVRILTATNKDLVEMVKDGSFREDLYYRLNVVMIKVPTLRERIDDIPLLVDHFLSKETAQEQKPEISKTAMKKLMAYDWPGNVRQLENIIKRAVILAIDNRIDEDDIQFDDLRHQNIQSALSGTMEELKNMIIKKRIEEFGGNKTHAAKSLDISLRSLQAKAKELGL